MRNSHKDLIEVCNEESGYLAGLTACKWMDHISLILKGSIKIAKGLRSGSSILIHCSDGWDRTPQVRFFTFLSTKLINT